MSEELPVNAWCRLEGRSLVRLAGEEASSFLQGLVSNDVDGLASEPARYAALLTPQGKYLFDFLMIADGEDLLLEVEADRRDALIKRLMLYRLRARVTIEPVDEWGVFVWLGDAAPADLGEPPVRAVRDPRLSALGWRIIGPPAAIEASLQARGPEIGNEAYRAFRIGLGVPEGTPDLTPDKSLLLESGFVELHGVCFDKGCFVGQELTARMRYRATVRKRLLPLRFDGDVEAGAAIVDGATEVGEVHAVAGSTGLGLIRLDRWQRARDAGRSLQAGAVAVEPSVPDWVDLSFASKTADSSA